MNNTNTDLLEVSGGTSWVDDWGHVGATFRYYDNDYGIPGGFIGGHEDGVRVEMERTGPFESATDGYAVFDLSAGVRITVRGRLNVITVRGENLGNTEYRNHLSRVKEIMPEAGRSISVAYRVVF